jgi:hypothetical protein
MFHLKLRHLLPWIAVALLVGCGMDSLKPSRANALDRIFYEYSSDLRWGDFDAAYAFVDPKSRAEHPLSDLERARFKQVEVSGYEVVSRVDGEGTVDQQVQLGLINRNTQVPRTILYHEHWRWDAEKKNWWLESGLPDIAPQD